MSIYSSLVRPALFSFDSESVHDICVQSASLFSNKRLQGGVEYLFRYDAPVLQTTVAGLRVSSPIGLAAGFDKNCRMVPFLHALGFGHVEVGSITGVPQGGNPRPRIFRLPRDKALINRMGFPSDGAENVAKRFATLQKSQCKTGVVGINLGKSKVTPIEDALDDYKRSFTLLREYGDYFVLNVSSPNTPELRKLQERDRLQELFRGVQELNAEKKPIFVKVAPDLT
jgi:dihydroorotate dehydrogenase